MTDDPLVRRIERFERTVATCLCVVPALFAGQCLAVSLGIPAFRAMFADFGSPLPAFTESPRGEARVHEHTGVVGGEEGGVAGAARAENAETQGHRRD